MRLRIGLFACLMVGYALAAADIARADGIADINAGLAQTAHGNYQAAAQFYTRALKSGNLSEPNKAVAYLDRCNADVLGRDHEHAIADCSMAIQLSPADADTYTGRCAAYNGSGDYDRGIADCTAAIALQPRDPWPYNNRCDAYVKKADYAQAIADCNRAIQLSAGLVAAPRPVVPGDERCLVEARLGADIQADLGCAPRDRPNSVVSALYANRGEAYFEAGQFSLAAADIQHVQSTYIGSLRRDIWLFLALGRSDRMDLALSVLRNARLPADTWDTVLASFLRGDMSATQLRSRARNLSGTDQMRATCDALFVIGERGLILDRGSAIRDALADVSQRCARVRPDEHAVAVAEIRRFATPQRNGSFGQ